MATPSPLYGGTTTRRVTVHDLMAAKARGERWPMITSYDALTAALFDAAGFPVLLVGDSAGMVVLGHENTLPVTVEEMVCLTAAVVRGSSRAMVVADLPFGSYTSPERAVDTAVRFVKEAGAHAVKLEGGGDIAPTVTALLAAGIPVMGHIGLRPQHVHAMGGYRVQGRGEQGDSVLSDAQALAAAGVFAIVLEVIPSDLAARITAAVPVPTIGIGAGPHTDAQVNVWQDLVGLTPGTPAKFVKRYADVRSLIDTAARAWAADVVSNTYPDAEHSYT